MIGLVAALAVAGLLLVLIQYRERHRELRRAPCSTSPARSPDNTQNIPQLEATAPVLGLIVEEAVVQDGYMNALTDGFGNGNGDR